MGVGRQREAEPFFLKVCGGHQRLLKLTLLAQICWPTLGHWEAAGLNASRFPWIACLQPAAGWEGLASTTEAKRYRWRRSPHPGGWKWWVKDAASSLSSRTPLYPFSSASLRAFFLTTSLLFYSNFRTFTRYKAKLFHSLFNWHQNCALSDKFHIPHNSLQFYCLDQIKIDIKTNSNTQIDFLLNIYDSLVLIQ